jgi:hypothetical protein
MKLSCCGLRPEEWGLVGCAGGIILSFMLNGVALEELTQGGTFHSELSLLCFTSFVYALIAKVFVSLMK